MLENSLLATKVGGCEIRSVEGMKPQREKAAPASQIDWKRQPPNRRILAP